MADLVRLMFDIDGLLERGFSDSEIGVFSTERILVHPHKCIFGSSDGEAIFPYLKGFECSGKYRTGDMVLFEAGNEKRFYKCHNENGNLKFSLCNDYSIP